MYSLSSSTIIPVRFDELSQIILSDYAKEGLPKLLRKQLSEEYHSAVELAEKSMKDFYNQTIRWHQYVDRVMENESAISDPFEVRHINDISMKLERIFTENSGQSLYQRPDTRNILLGTSLSDFYSTVFFPGLFDLLDEIKYKETLKTNKRNHDELRDIQQELKDLQQELRRHLSDITIAFQVATRILQEKPI